MKTLKTGVKLVIVPDMNFREKLTRRVAQLGLNKSKASRDAGLPDSTISAYLAKEDSLPRLDIAAKIAKAIRVPLSWLADDSAEWPPPETDTTDLSSINDDVLIFEVCKRLMPYFLDYLDALAILESLDWSKAKVFRDWQPGGPIPGEIGDLVGALALFSQAKRRLQRYDPRFRYWEFRGQLKGKDRPYADFTSYGIQGKLKRLRARPGFNEASLISESLQHWQAETGEQYVDFLGDDFDPHIETRSPPQPTQPAAGQDTPISSAAPPKESKRARETKPLNPTSNPHTRGKK